MTGKYPNTYYAATKKLDLDTHSLNPNKEVETCIIGGGYAGLMTALGLVERGHKSVAIIEKNGIGFGCSGRNGGLVFGGYSLSPHKLIKQVGSERAKELYQFTQTAVNLIRRRVVQYTIDCDLVDKGVIWANWFKDQKLLNDEQSFMNNNLGVKWEYISPEALREQLQTDRYHGGLFEPSAMHFHPLNYALGIARELIKQGVRIYENCEVTDIKYEQAVRKVKTAQGDIQCKNIVLCGGGYLGNLFKPVSNSILPIATYVMTTEPLGDKLKESINTQSAVYDTRFAFDYYRPLKDTRILWGGRIHTKTNKPKNLKHILQQDMLKVYPQLEGVRVEYDWQGFMAYARHHMAQIGQVAPNVWYNIGFGGHGVAPTTAAGEIVAAAITKENEDYKKFEPWGLPWNGGMFGPPAAQLSYWWYQLKDWWKEKTE
ncbi:NAD(P)/FAD-dependent oxidoreductase [Kangiella sediminilitoris]|uniref:FAD dependent oxidoreductase n=1 Tax=Kangiella sediminilitoris TaxID=1144748 RepID=A0A1B3B9W8_9GAMM|nr:FAD-binding oxidoreductase [Kangiella sediminilitoris]AOE49599.1 FAD dependent oxidoreductase [Kangiella sediminilitoris]